MPEMPHLHRSGRGLRHALAMSALTIGWLAAPPASAAGFVEACKSFSAAMSDGKAQAEDEGVCTCIRSKLSEDDEGKATTIMQTMIDAKKAGKKSETEPTADQKAVMEKLAQAGDACEGGK